MRHYFASIILSLFVVGIAFAKTTTNPSHSEANRLYQPAGSPIIGNPKGAITLVEFFDYNCGHCRLIYPQIEAFVKKNPDIRLIYREYPILSERSLLPAQAALAANKQGKYLAMQEALLTAHQPLNEAEIMRLAQMAHIETKQLAKDMQSPAITKQLQANISLGNLLDIKAIPTFIIAKTVSSSTHQPVMALGPSMSDLKKLIQEARQN